MNACTVADCDRPAGSRGWCKIHYLRWYKWGDPARPPHLIVGDPVRRFWSHVDKTATCWLWTSEIARGGYGRISIGRRHFMAHRFAYELLVGPIPEGLELDHLCRVRHCVNPSHLEPVTSSVNIQRAFVAKGGRPMCRNGLHSMTGSNVGIRWRGGKLHRQCKACKSAGHRRWREGRTHGGHPV